MTERISRIRELLPGAVLLPVASRKKTCYEKGWQKVTFAASLAPGWQKLLCSHANTAVLLGKNSDNLISIDCDTEDFFERFLAANPALSGTLITKGARGGNFWFRIPAGPYPPTTKLFLEGRAAGEFRSSGAYTMISGTHPDGMDYRFFSKAAPLVIRYEDVHWPEGTRFKDESRKRKLRKGAESEGFELPIHPPSSEICTPVSLCISEACDSVSSMSSIASLPLYDSPQTHGEPAMAKGTVARSKEFKKNFPVLATLLDPLLGGHLPLQDGERNTVLTHSIVPILFTAVGWKSMWILLKHLTETHRLGGYPQDELAEKCSHVWAAMEAEYPGRLGPGEEADYAALEGPEKELYRICRSLASIGEETGKFFLSGHQAGARLAMPDGEAAAHLKSFCRDYGFMKIVQKGLRWQKGEKPLATCYQWLLSVEEIS